MRKDGPLGDAWLYIYEKTGPVYANKSRNWLHTQLCIASNDLKIASIKRNLYQQIADTLD